VWLTFLAAYKYRLHDIPSSSSFRKPNEQTLTRMKSENM
jgi:hypothetical protein